MCMLQATCMKKGGENANFRPHILLTGKHNSIGNVRLLSYTSRYLFFRYASLLERDVRLPSRYPQYEDDEQQRNCPLCIYYSIRYTYM